MNDPARLVQLQGIGKDYGTLPVLRDVNLQIHAGESLAIVGPSGCGKSTLLNIIGGLLGPTAGTIEVDGKSLQSMNEEQRATLRNQSMGFVFQSHHLLPQCTAIENVLLPTLVHPDQGLRLTAPQRASDLLIEVGLKERMHHRPSQLSGGECQRVAVVRALINQPKLLLADEPTGSLDEAAAEDLSALLCRLNQQHKVALLTVTHATNLAAAMQRTVRLHRGQLVS